MNKVSSGAGVSAGCGQGPEQAALYPVYVVGVSRHTFLRLAFRSIARANRILGWLLVQLSPPH